jgi:hypothetical protein
MTEAEWMACTDPGPMLDFILGKATDRKLRLFAVTCCRRVWPLLKDQRSRQAVEVAETYADGQASQGRLCDAHEVAFEVTTNLPWGPGREAAESADWTSWEKAEDAAELAAQAAARVSGSINLRGEDVQRGWSRAQYEMEKTAQVSLLRDIFGPLPFQPVTIHAHVLAWNDRLVVRLAQAIYDERRWADLPILADALLDAGCDQEEVLAHCRAGGDHVRGCWVVDLLLGKG